MSDKTKKYLAVGAIVLAVLWFLTRTKPGASIVQKAGELFPAIAPYVPTYEGGDVIVNLESPKNGQTNLPVIPSSQLSRQSDCNMCGVSDNVQNLLPAGELARFGGLSGNAIINAVNWWGETDALYKNADPSLLIVEYK